ncbi:MAG: hypothetical protein ACT4PI_19055 [Actinomycetota bacterium]
MRDTALALARLRASRTRSAADSGDTRLPAAAAAAGRRVVRVTGPGGGTEVTLGWGDAVEPDPDAQPFAVQRLSPSALATLAVCLRCCWPEASRDPLPGRAVGVREVLIVAAAAGIDLRWAKAALLHDLPAAGFVALDDAHHDPTVRLGPALAGWPDGQWALMRRSHERLPTHPNEGAVAP